MAEPFGRDEARPSTLRLTTCFLLLTSLFVPDAPAQTPQTPPPPPKSFSSTTGTKHLEGLDVDFLVNELETLKTKDFVANALEIAKQNSDLANIILQTLTFSHLMELKRWTQVTALSTYALVAPDSEVAFAIAHCYVGKIADIEGLRACIEGLNDPTKNRGAFVQEQLGFQTGTLLATVFTVADDLALVKKYVFDWQVDSTSGRHVQASKPSTMRLRFDEIRDGIWPKLGSADGTCDKATVPSSITINKSDTDTTGTKKPFLMAQTLDIDADVYVEAMSDSTLCKKLADALAIEAVETEAQSALDKLGAREIKSLNEREQAKLEYEIAYLQRERGLWNGSAWVMDRAYPAFRDRVRKMAEDRFKQVQEMTGGRK